MLGVADSHTMLAEDVEQRLRQRALAASFDAAHDDCDFALLARTLDQACHPSHEPVAEAGVSRADDLENVVLQPRP